VDERIRTAQQTLLTEGGRAAYDRFRVELARTGQEPGVELLRQIARHAQPTLADVRALLETHPEAVRLAGALKHGLARKAQDPFAGAEVFEAGPGRRLELVDLGEVSLARHVGDIGDDEVVHWNALIEHCLGREQPWRLFFDMTGPRYANGMGLSCFVKFADGISTHGGGIVLIGMPAKIALVFDMLGLDAFFERCECPDEVARCALAGARLTDLHRLAPAWPAEPAQPAAAGPGLVERVRRWWAG
jgi:anti-anti-sigma regulatory factor